MKTFTKRDLIAWAIIVFAFILFLGIYLYDRHRTEEIRSALIATLEGKTPTLEVDIDDRLGFIAECKNKAINIRADGDFVNRLWYSGTCGSQIVISVACHLRPNYSCLLSDTPEAHRRKMNEKIDRDKGEIKETNSK